MKVFLLFDHDGVDRREAGSVLESWSQERGHELSTTVVDRENLRSCLGCFGCWVKTPGVCVIRGDGGEALLKRYLAADLVVFAGAVPYGSFSLPIKTAIERFLPALSPDFRRFRGEMHHVQRYRRTTRLVSVAFGDPSPDEEETHLELVRSFCDNADSPRQLRFFRWTGAGVDLVRWLNEEVAS